MRRNGKRLTRTTARSAGITLGSAAAAAGGWIAYSRFFLDHNRNLPHAMDAARRRFRSRYGMLSAYSDTTAPGRPLALVHSVNAAASAYEMRPLFERYRGVRPVHALDLPGFGFSDRGDARYSPEFYAGAIQDWLEHEVQGQPADVLALSLGCEFAALAAMERPELVHSLAFISPTGFSSRPAGGMPNNLDRFFSPAPLAQAFYDLLVSRPSIRYYLGKSFEGPVDAGLAKYAYATSHQPDARFAPLRFVSGRLFTPDVAGQVYTRLSQSVLVLYDRDGYVDFERLPAFLDGHSNWCAERIPGTRGLPHFEKPDETCAPLDLFWASIPKIVEIRERSGLS